MDHQLAGHWLMYDQVNRELVGNFVEMWATDTECGFIMSDGLGGPREMIRFDQPHVVWAMTCMMRMMRRQATIDE